MFPADVGSSARSQPAPPPPPPPPKTDTVQHGDTIESVAERNGVTAPELAQANGLDELQPLNLGQVLTVPPQAAQEAEQDPVPDTPAKRTDQAIKRYDDAVKARAEGMKNAPHNMGLRSELEDSYNAQIATAKQNVTVAVQQEIGSQVAVIPRSIGLSTDSMISGYAKSILGRHAGDTNGTAAINDAVTDYRTQSAADAIAQTDVVGADVTPLDRVNALKGALTGASQDVIDRVLQEPRVQSMLTDAAKWVSDGYSGDNEAANAAQRLGDLTDGLPPDLAADLIQKSMPTIQKIAAAGMNPEGFKTQYGPLTNLSRAVDALGDSSQAGALKDQIAQAYMSNEDVKYGGFPINVGAALGQGVSPALSVAIAQKLAAAGNTSEAGDIMKQISFGLDNLKGKLTEDLKHYGEMTQELNQVISDTTGLLTPAEQQKAINAYIKSKGPEWQQQLSEAEHSIEADVKSLNRDAVQIRDLPPELAKLDPDLQDKVTSVLEDDTVQQAESFALSRDPSILEGDEGGKATEVLTELSHKSKDLTDKLAQAYISGHVLPEVGNLNPNDPASVARVEKALSDLRGKAALLGIPQSELDGGVNKLEQIVKTLQTTKSTDTAVKGLYDLDKVKKELGELKDTPFSTGAAGVAFRTLGVALSGGVLLNQLNTTIDNPNAQNLIGSLAYSAGLAQDAGKFAASVKLLDSNGALAKWATSGNVAGALTEKFIGVLNIGYYTAGAITDANAGSVPGVAFDVSGVAGSALLAFGEELGAGAWAGPVGVGLTLIAAAGKALVEYRAEKDEKTEADEKFLQGAGLDEETAKALSQEATDSSHVFTDQLGMTPAQVQELAEKHPELFDAPGYAQAAVDAAKACGIGGEDVTGFIDALAKDDPNYVSTLFNQRVADDGMHPMSHANTLFTVLSANPDVRAFIQQHAPEQLTQAASDRRQADSDFESLSQSDTPSIANLIKSHSSPAYQAEIVKILRDQNRLDSWVQSLSTNYAYNDWPQAGRSAILAAEGQGVLSQEEGQAYVNQLP